MAIIQKDKKTEGWLYVIHSNRLGLHYSRKRYFVLEDNCLNCFKSVPLSNNEDLIGSAIIDSCARVSDDGRERIRRKRFFTFSLYNASNHCDQLKLGTRCPEEAAKWIHSFKEAILKECPNHGVNVVACPKRKHHSFILSDGKRTSHMSSVAFIDWTVYSSQHNHRETADVVAPSPWTLFGCQNGLRLFKEAKDGDFHGKSWDDHPATMAIGVVHATAEVVFQVVMSLGPSRREWDYCFYDGNVIEHLDGHTDIIHMRLNNNCLRWGMKRRDLLLRRYWRREDDGTYVILYHSVFHRKCPHKSNYIRAYLKSGGYVISPTNQGKQSVVKNMLAVDWKFWKTYLLTSSSRSVTIRILSRIAAMRELFTAKVGNCTCSAFSASELTKEIGLPQFEKEDIKVEVQSMPQTRKSEDLTEEAAQKSHPKIACMGGSFLQLNDASEEFFDVPNQSDYDQSDSSSFSDPESETQSQDPYHPKLPTAAGFVKKLHDLAVHKKGFMDLQEAARTTLPNDPSCTLACSWTTADPSSFFIRGENYLHNNEKVKAKGTLMQMVAADWLQSDKREDDLGGRPLSIVQKHAMQGHDEFFFIVNIQVPGSTTYNLVLYYMLDAPVESIPLLDSFVNGDDAYRNSRFKLIPYISEGSWIVKQSVGKKACLVGHALEINYFRGKNYLELGIDVGSSTVAKGVVSLVLGYVSNLVIEMAFLIQGNTQEELPECLLGTCRLNHLDTSKSVVAS